MNMQNWLQLVTFLIILLATTRPVGLYMQKVFDGEKILLSPVLRPLERLIYKCTGTDPTESQPWSKYSIHLLIFSAVTFFFTYGILSFQQYLPLNPSHFGNLSSDLAFNTAMSFATNTNWQSYSGESTMSYFSQMVGLTLQNFFSASVGMSAAIALIRGISLRESKGIGNFWADLVRANLYILLPICVVYAVFLMSQGIIQNFSPPIEVTTLEGLKQVIPQGPVASQVAIKMLGTNGGGFFNANAAHPYENPTPFSNLIQMLSIFLIPSGFVYLLGSKTKNLKHGWAVWGSMLILFLAGFGVCYHFEQQGNPVYTSLGCSSNANWEGKEARFGIFNSSLFATVTTDASCGAVNAMHDSFTPLGGMVPLINIMLGEIVFGGVGSGLYGMMMYIILTVFIAGLMVGRTPEYLGKKIEGREVKCVMIALIVAALSILGFTAVGSVYQPGLSSLGNPGAHGFSEILYAFTSATGNNGSAFAGLNANTPFWNITIAFAMFFGRFLMMIPMLAVAGSLAKKRIHPGGEGSFPVDSFVFMGLLLGVIILVGALTYFPALCLGPIAEYFKMLQGQFIK